MRALIALAALAASILAGRGTAAAQAGEAVLPMVKFVEVATINNPDIFAQLTRLGESEALVEQSRAVYDIVFNVHYSRLYDKPYSEFSSVKIREQTTDTLGSSLAWNVPYVGTRVRGGFDYYWNRITVDTPTAIPPFTPQRLSVDLYSPDIFVEVQQPLLRNWLGIVDSFPLRQAKLNRLVVKETVNESMESIMTDLFGLYLRWYLAYHQLQIYTKNVVNSELLLKQITQRYRAGLTDLSDVSKTRIVTTEYTKSRDIQSTRFQNLSSKINRWYYGMEGAAKRPAHVPEHELVIPPPQFSHFTISRTRQMRILDLTKRLLQQQLEKERSELLPELNAVFSYHPRNYDTSRIESIQRYDYNNYTAGLTFNFPLGNSLAQGNIEETRVALRKWGNDVASFERSYTQTYGDFRNTIAAYEKLLRQDDDLVAQSRTYVAAEEKKYNQGRGDLYFVIQARNMLLNYELLRNTDYAELKSLNIQLLNLMDQTRKQ